MSELLEIERQIEKVRSTLNSLVVSNGGFTSDKEVAALSAQLDQLIVRYAVLRTSTESESVSKSD
ncbi:MAG: Spo0E like sporulation regulatory protein [Firmicutes bacterium]|nr:Spo0E like sporulation regulatory protein [Bacillota bacterium]